ncbi:MAG: serine/threonine-protein kinase [Acidobacteria bacterium]|nr:serine/threonine-protein kinase [Acidobacteriota bacterium]
MPLASGAQLGPYDIVAPLGAGGMGEVYRARDSRLARDVALKVLPEAFSKDAERMARFDREAQVLASFSHPNIATLHGIEESGGVRALVMELVEGPTLGERIAQGPIPLEDALPIAKQIAEALEAAHDRGIIHRDLKPANIKLRPDGAVKVLDFGLAKALDDEPAASGGSNSPTLSLAATRMGVILGTAAYMAPEQAKGRPVDRRADIWAFGAVLMEMLTGRRMYSAPTAAETLALVMTTDPGFDALPGNIPASIHKLLRRCLDKEPKRRLQAIGEARIAIDEYLAGPLSGPDVLTSTRGWRSASRWAVAALAIAAATGWFAALRPRGPAPARLHVEVLPPPGVALAALRYNVATQALSPDGRYLVFCGSRNRQTTLWLHAFDTGQARELDGTAGALAPFWSPDSHWIAFAMHGQLWKTPIEGGPPSPICRMIGQPLGGDWNAENLIVFGDRGRGAIQWAPAGGGEPKPATVLDAAREDLAHSLPQFLPGGRSFLFGVMNKAYGFSAMRVGRLGDSPTGGADLVLPPSSGQAMYVPVAGHSDGTKGFLLVRSGSRIYARRFDLSSLSVEGEPVLIGGPVEQIAGISQVVSVSNVNSLAYNPAEILNAQLSWFSRDGRELSTLGQPGTYFSPQISPDGTRVVVARGETSDPQAQDIWIFDLARNVPTRLTNTPHWEGNPQWSPDGRRVAFLEVLPGSASRVPKVIAAGGGQAATFPFTSQRGGVSLLDWSRDGRFIFTDARNSIQANPAGGGDPFIAVQATARIRDAQLSPDGRWLAFTSTDSGSEEVCVTPFSGQPGSATPERTQISPAGGTQPRWRGDSRELYFVSGDDKMMAVEIQASAQGFSASPPKALFTLPPMLYAGQAHQYAVSPRGDRFLVVKLTSAASRVPIHVLMNWQQAASK